MKKKLLLSLICAICLIIPITCCLIINLNKDDKNVFNIKYDYNIDFDVEPYFDNYTTTKKIKVGSNLDSLPTPVEGFDIFRGWYIKGTNTAFTSDYKVDRDLKVEAQWTYGDHNFALNCANFEYDSILGGYSCEIDTGKNLVIVPTNYAGEQGSLPIVKICKWSEQEYDNPQLTQVIMTNDIKEIGSGTFANCTLLDKINLGGRITTISDYAFYNCDSLDNIRLPRSLKNIGQYAFSKCDKLNNIELAENLEVIDSYAFAECKALKDITIADGISSIKSYAFMNCDELETFLIPRTIKTLEGNIFNGCDKLSTIQVLPGVENIGDSAFEGMTSLKNIYMYEGLLSIGANAFASCESIEYISFPNTLLAIGENAFSDCIKLNNLVIPASVNSIGQDAFVGCFGITYFSVQKENEVYDSRDNCNALIETATNTFIKAFKNCVIPDSVEVIGKNAFSGLAINSIVIPSSVTTISDEAFDSMENESFEEIIIDSQAIANGLCEESSFGYLSSKTLIIHVKSSLIVDNSTYLLENFIKQENGNKYGYDMYARIPGEIVPEV